MKTMVKKTYMLILALLMVISAMFVVAINMQGKTTAKADEETALPITKFSISTDESRILFVTPLVDDEIELIYEVGYTFSGDMPVGVNCATNKYYSSLSFNAGDPFTARDIFGDDFEEDTPMIVWEVENDALKTFTATAYYKKGEIIDTILYPTEPETQITGTAKTAKLFTVSFNVNGGTPAVANKTVAAGTSASDVLDGVADPTKANRPFVRWENGGEVFLGTTVTADTVIDAVYAPIDCDYALDYTAYDEGWYNPADLTEIDFGIANANKTVNFSMKVCGTADPEGTSGALGFLKSDRTWIQMVIARENISSTASWNTITGTWTLDENGKMKTSACDYSGNCEPFTIFIKDAEITHIYTADELSAISTTLAAPSSYVAYMYAGNPSSGAAQGLNGFRALGGMDYSGYSTRRGFMFSKAAIKSVLDLGYDTVSFKLTTTSYSGADVPGYVLLWISGGATDWAISDSGTGAADVYASGSTVKIDLQAMYADITGRGSDAGLGFVLRTDASTDAAGAAYIYLTEIVLETVYNEDIISALNVMTTASNYISQYALGSPISGTKVGLRAFKAGCGMDSARPSRGYMLAKAAIKSVLDLGFDTMSFKLSTPNAAYIELWISGGAVDYLITTPDLGTAHYANGSTVEVDLAKLYADINVDGRNGLGFFLKTDASTYYTAAADELMLSNISFGKYPASVKALAVMTNSGSYISNWGVGNPTSGTKVSENVFQAGCGMDGSYSRRGYMLSKAAIKSLVDLGLETMTITLSTPNAAYIELWISGGAVDYLITTPDAGTSNYASGSEIDIDLVKLYADISSSNGLGFILKTDASTYYTAAADVLTITYVSFS